MPDAAKQESNARPTDSPKSWTERSRDSMGEITDYSFGSFAVKESKMGGGMTTLVEKVKSQVFKMEERGRLGGAVSQASESWFQCRS